MKIDILYPVLDILISLTNMISYLVYKVSYFVLANHNWFLLLM